MTFRLRLVPSLSSTKVAEQDGSEPDLADLAHVPLKAYWLMPWRYEKLLQVVGDDWQTALGLLQHLSHPREMPFEAFKPF